MASAGHGVWYSLIYKDQDSEKAGFLLPSSADFLSWPSILSVLPWNRIQNLGPWTESLWCDSCEEKLSQLRKMSITSKNSV